MKRISILLAIILTCVISGCGKKNNNNEYYLYYVDAGHNSLKSYGMDFDVEDVTSLVNVFLNKMHEAPNENMDKAVPETVALVNFYIDGNNLNLNFSEKYYDLPSVDAAFFRAAIVLTMTQLEGVDNVIFFVAGESMKDSNGKEIGILNNNSVILNSDQLNNSTNVYTTGLFFADESGEKLIEEERDVVYSENKSLEQAVVEALISGPVVNGNKRTLPKELKVINITTKDGTCYINLNKAFIDSIVDVSAKATIYSIVNSLCELTTVNRVHILVDGNVGYTFRENYKLSDYYERSLDLIKKEE